MSIGDIFIVVLAVGYGLLCGVLFFYATAEALSYR